jgi:dipeptidyl aminopeptidase/acylaminoacyl peptidase
MAALGPDVVRRQAVIGACALSPDGEWAVYTRRTVVGNAYRTNLWIVPFAGGRPRRLTSGAGNDTSPAFAPDGRTLAFVSDRGEGDDGRLYLIRLDGGEAELVCGAPHGSVGPPVFSPDGRQIAFTGWAGEPRFWTGDPDRKLARVIRTVDWRNDSGDRDYRSHLHVVAARPGARPRTVTEGDFDVSEPAWHPDGERIAFATNRNPRGDLRPKTVIHEVRLEGGEVHGLIGLRGTAYAPAWSPDGATLAFVGSNVPGAPDYAEPQLYVWDGARRPRSLTGRLDLPVTLGWCSDLHDWMHAELPPPRWEGDDALVVPVNRRGRDEVWRVPLRGDAGPLTSGDTTLGGLDAAAGRVVATATDDAYPPEVCAVEPDGLRRLTRHGGAWLRTHAAPRVREVDAGGVPSFLIEPARRRRRSALVLSPHGGPYGAHGPTPELDSWLLAELGYRVLLPNIRGSGGYGADWIKPIQGRWGGPDADDLLTALDWAVGEGLADPDRIAAMGLSYGGWAVNWLAGAAPGRFRAIVSENGVASMEAAHAVSCIGPGFDRDIGYGPAYQHRDAMWRSSPLRLVRRITAPMLMLQGEADRICPLDDTYQLFVALRELGRDVELVLYPEEHHVMMATARPDRRIDRFQRIADFLTKHCPP